VATHPPIAPGGLAVYNGSMLLILWNIVYIFFYLVYVYLYFAWTVIVTFFRVNWGI